jgi:hypothetical protein
VPHIFSAVDIPPALLIGLIVFAVLGILGVLAIAGFLISERLDDSGFDDQFEFLPGPTDNGAAFPDFVNEASLRHLASHHELGEVPAQIQETQGAAVKGGAPQGVLSGEHSHQTTVTHKPHDDLGELIRKIVRHLFETNELNQSIDRIWIEDIMVEAVPNFADPERAQEAFEAWLEENYPHGFDGVAPAQLAEELARLGEQFPQKRICERLKTSFEGVVKNDPEAVLYLEGEWAVASNDETVDLSRTNLRVESPTPLGPQERSIPMPEGAAITMQLPKAELTRHGKTRMVGVSRPIRARVLATMKQYDPNTGCFELVPIAVYQLVGNK